MSTDKNVIPRSKDLPGQLGLDGQYAKKPDEACAKNVGPLTPPKRGKLPKVKEKYRVFNLRTGPDACLLLPSDDFGEREWPKS